MSNKTKKTAEFTLVDSQGNEYRVLEFTAFVSVVSDGRAQLILNRKQFQLESGVPVNFSESSGFEIASSGIRLSIPPI